MKPASRKRRTAHIALVCAALAAAAAPSRAVAQASPEPRIAVHAAHLDAAQRASVARLAERALAVAESELGHSVTRPVEVTLVADLDRLEPGLRRAFQGWTAAVALTQQARVVVAMPRITPDPPADLDSTLRHELVHIVLGELERELAQGRRLPRWLHEGIAQVVAGELLLGGSEKTVYFRVKTGRVIGWSALDDAWPEDEDASRAAYAQSASFLGYLFRELGAGTVMRAARAYLDGSAENLDLALSRLRPGETFTSRSATWIREVEQGRLLAVLLQDHCFHVLILLAVPLLAIVLYKRARRERAAAARLERWEQIERMQRERRRRVVNDPQA